MGASMTLMSVSSNETGGFRSQPRWSANRKIDVVLRLLRGESLEEVSREVGVEAHRLQAWRDDFLVPRGELGWSFDARSW
jgi:transposase-like protein